MEQAMLFDEWHGRVYLKCGLMRRHWTHGPGTDIKAKWPACGSWEPSRVELDPLIPAP